jgi:hypothetical protein
MTVKEAQRELERIGAELENAIEQLVETPTAVEQWPATLQATLEALQRTQRQFPSSAESDTFRPMVQRLQSRVRQVHLLLESAALFYCGCVAVSETDSTGYTHHGALEQFASGGRMQLEA